MTLPRDVLGLLAAIQFGTLAGWTTAIGAFVVAMLVYRSGGGGAMGILKTANEVLEHRCRELLEQAARDRATIEGLQASRDFAQAVAPFVQQLHDHDSAHLEALARILAALEAIEVRLAAAEQ